MSAPLFTVYLPSCNKGKYLAEAVESMLRQSAGDWELLLIDVGSTDTTAEVMRLYQGDERIRTFSMEKTPLPAVCNFALAQARGGYIMRLDGDDILEENILLVLGAYLDRHPDAALVFPDYYLINEVGDILSLEVRDRVYHGDHLMDQPPNGACTMIRADVLRALDGYREDLGAQDAYRPLLAAIPCRRNYDFVPDLWSVRLKGRSLLQIKVENCLRVGLFDKVVVYCDTTAAQEHLEELDDPRLAFMLRNPASTIRSVNLAMALRPLAARYDPEFRGATVINYIQTPFVSPQTLQDACFSLAANEADASLGVEEVDQPLYKRTALGLAPLRTTSIVHTSRETFYRETRACMATRNRNIRDGSLTGARVTSFIMANEEAFFIDSRRMLRIGRLLLEMGECDSQ